ncbi:unnamed protein product [Parnassius mnemosyne]|uniref:Protein phosphatase 1 regulatory subunit 35 C-terminal domain-containing protein n=1 Tax=Parnassius mnemosyne TaxID=213953 RepID=A0AAV1KVF1_9NEOP
MKKCGSDPKVTKTLIRNYEQKPLSKVKEAAYETQATSSSVLHKKSTQKGRSSNNNNVLSCPSLCSSEVLANYLSDVTKNLSPPPVDMDLDVDKALLNTKMTRMLNFHFNDRMYKNLVELNANGDVQKRIKDKRPNKFAIKKDLEPHIEDFINDEKDEDLIPTIPVPITKFKPVKKVENGKLHKLISSFEKL